METRHNATAAPAQAPASPSTGSSTSSRASRPAPILVLVKTITCCSCRSRTSRATAARLASRSATRNTSCSTFSAVALRRATSIRTGSFRKLSASLRISVEKVAENIRFWRRAGSAWMIRWMSGRKPMSSIRSASSSTSSSACPSDTVFWPMWSSSRPGVAISTSQPCRIAAICGRMSTPPNTTADFRPVYFAYSRTFS